MVSAAVFGFGVNYMQQGTGKIYECLSSNNELRQKILSLDATVTVLFQDTINLREKKYHLADGASCKVYQNVPVAETSGVVFSQTHSIMGLSDKVKEKYQFDNYTVIVDTESLEWYYGLYADFDLVVNELLETRLFNITRLQAKVPNGETLFFDKGDRVGKLEVLVRSFCGLVILDVVSLLYIYSTIVSAPAFLVTLIDMFHLHGTITRLNVYKVFPWIGLYMHPLDRRAGAKYLPPNSAPPPSTSRGRCWRCSSSCTSSTWGRWCSCRGCCSWARSTPDSARTTTASWRWCSSRACCCCGPAAP